MSYKKLTIFTDGACSGNPGPAGIGVVVKDGDQVVGEVSRYIGEATNNIAEYSALVAALIEARKLGAAAVEVMSDSELMVKQVQGLYAVKQEHLAVLVSQVKELALGFGSFSITHVPREQNKAADKLSTEAIARFQRDSRPRAAGQGEESPSSKG